MIETERLILRTFREEDAADLYEYLHEPMVHCFACMKVNSLEEGKRQRILFCHCPQGKRQGDRRDRCDA